MLTRIFSFSNLTLLVALLLSTIAAWYSIIGLTTIFSGAVIPVIIMGSVLELAKITTTVWLRKYWHRAGWLLKSYLVPAVMAIALITSMGIFGFLSKAHMDQGVTSGDVQAKVALIDEKIKISKENIDVNRKALKQLDDAVDQVMGRSTSEAGADKSVAIRRSQSNDRKRLLAEIQAEQKTISLLNEEGAPIRAENRKVEAEVGPIKYIAALIYGDNPDQNILERSVRWVIILLVVVFDPLALMLVLAANSSKEWDNEEQAAEDDFFKKGKVIAKRLDAEAELKATEADKIVPDEPIIEIPKEHAKSISELHPYLNTPFDHFKNLQPIVYKHKTEKPSDPELDPCYKCGTPLINAPGIGPFCPNKECDVFDGPLLKENPIEITYIPVAKTEVDQIETTGITIAKPFTELEGGYVVYEGKHMHKEVLKNMRPDVLKLVADSARQINTNFGTEFPKMAEKGDTFVRVDVLPNKVYKFDGIRWISVNKEQSTSYLYDQEYISYLVGKIEAGEYDVELLSDIENQQIEEFLTKKT